MKMLRRALTEDEGATIVEFALAAPIVILIVVCCIDFARAIDAYVVVTSAARDGARYATLHPDPSAIPSIQAYVVRRAAPLAVETSDVNVAFGAPSADWAPSAPRPITVTVSVQYPWQAVTWVAGTFISATGARTFRASSTMGAMR